MCVVLEGTLAFVGTVVEAGKKKCRLNDICFCLSLADGRSSVRRDRKKWEPSLICVSCFLHDPRYGGWVPLLLGVDGLTDWLTSNRVDM